MVDNDIHPEIIELAKQFFQSSVINAKLKLCEGAEEMLSFVHRDLHFNNIIQFDHVSVKLVDWQCCGLGNPLFDVFYMICFTSDLNTVESVEKEYLDNYYICICKELEQ
ncbi:predicted protein [Naegleria gruberi]|uniref:Predicted protein n=1 Tax=Naegleria gruberi TaxID=5762 RepID=D2VRA2_NAEGR|nr:uncharacterized protein NAEGRDRAFT_71515 [Naegleria gruberi]EFC40569.1 predicted protein [Naegleria gruberi]|eukprot:XP_002673313.1 predicted protein [Naegleria gruberi strain NEG-M]